MNSNKLNKYLYKLSQTDITDDKFSIYLKKLNYWYSQEGGVDPKNNTPSINKPPIYQQILSKVTPGDQKKFYEQLSTSDKEILVSFILSKIEIGDGHDLDQQIDYLMTTDLKNELWNTAKTPYQKVLLISRLTPENQKKIWESLDDVEQKKLLSSILMKVATDEKHNLDQLINYLITTNLKHELWESATTPYQRKKLMLFICKLPPDDQTKFWTPLNKTSSQNK